MLNKLRIPDALVFLGLAIACGSFLFAGGIERGFGFAGLLIAGAGYLWNRLFNA